jgi:hypothetical protein
MCVAFHDCKINAATRILCHYDTQMRTKVKAVFWLRAFWTRNIGDELTTYFFSGVTTGEGGSPFDNPSANGYG